MHSKTNARLRVSSQLGAGHEPIDGPVDPMDDDRSWRASRVAFPALLTA